MLVAGILLLGLFACGFLCVRGSAIEAIAALQLGGTLAALDLLALAEAFGRQPLGDLAIVLAALSLPGTLIFVRYLEEPD
jgi:multisubunit Na+/H+ antiporter MnhF subunit